MRRSLPLLTLFLLGCSGYKDVVYSGVKNASILSMDNRGVRIRADVGVDNPNGYRIKVMDPDVDIFLNGARVGKATMDSTLVLARRTSANYPIYLHATFEGETLPLLLTLFGSYQSGEVRVGAKGTVKAKATFLARRFPFEVEETLGTR